MAWTKAKDISRYQGSWQDTGEPIVIIKCGGGDDGLYYDSQCTSDYNAATAAGKAVGLYWFIGWTLGAEQEASFFLKGLSPLTENDVYALDIESGSVSVPENAVQYVTDMANFIHDNTGSWPLLYMNLSTLNAHDWSSLLANCGLWLADWAVSPDANIPTGVTYVMQQYSDGPNYDHDAFFGTVDQFKAYGYHAPQNTQAPAPTPPPVYVEVIPPVETPTAPQNETIAAEPATPEVEAPTPTSIPVQEVGQPKPVVVTVKPEETLWQHIIEFLKELFKQKG